MKKWMLPTALLAALSLSAATLVVDQKSSDPGVFRTIGEAAVKAGPGDVVLVHAGVYREHVAPEKGGAEEAPLIFRAFQPGTVSVRGSEVWKPEWKELPGQQGVFSTPVPEDAFFGEFPNPFRRRINAAGKDKDLSARPAEGELLPYSLGQIFCNGAELRQSQTVEEVHRVPGSWIITPEGSDILLHFPEGATPNEALLEMSVRDRVFAPARRGLGYIHIEGFIFEHCANQAPFPQLGMVSTRSGKHWVIRNNTIRHAKTVGLDIGSEYWIGDRIPRTTPEDQKLIRKGGYHLVTNNLITDNGLCGIAGWSCRESRITGNVIERNNSLSLSTQECDWEEWAGIKLHEADAVLVEGNLVRFNGAHGIWLDNGYDKARITRNALFGNVGTGIFIELGAGSVVIDNNIIGNTTPFSGYYPGRGIYAHDASGVKIYHNLIADNAAEGVYMRNVTDRKYRGKIVETSNAEVLNNIFCSNGSGVSFPPPGERSKNCVSDRNLFTGKVTFRYSGGIPWKELKLDESKFAAAAARDAFLPREWPEVSGWEANSIFLNANQFGIRLKPFEPSVYFFNRSGLTATLKPIAGLERDFVGNRYGDKVLPGPFQDLGKKSEYRLLFPVK